MLTLLHHQSVMLLEMTCVLASSLVGVGLSSKTERTWHPHYSGFEGLLLAWLFLVPLAAGVQ